jgi:hypothetical protein
MPSLVSVTRLPESIEVVTLVVYPIFVKSAEILVVKRLFRYHWIVVVDFTVTVKLVEIPFAFVSQLRLTVVKFSFTVHLIVFPFALIEASVLIIELALTVSHTIFLVALVTTANVVVLYHVFRAVIINLV